LSAPRQRGFSLIEVMIGVVLALISIVMMFQVQENFDKQRRSIVSGGDSQVSGAIAAFHLERDLRSSGSGFGNSAYLGCVVSAHDEIGSRDFTFTYVPVLITDGAAGAPDTVSVLAGNSGSPTATFDVAATTPTQTAMKDTRNGLALGDLVVVATPTPACWLAEVTNLQPVVPDNGRTIGQGAATYTRVSTPPQNRLTGAAGVCAGAGPWTCTPRFNPAAGSATYNSAPPVYGELRSLGDDPRLNVWSVDTVRGILQRTETLHESGAATSVADGVIDMQAQYGLDTNADDVVDTWQATTPTWAQVRIVRFALLARGQDYDKVALTTVAPTWAGGSFTMRNVDGTADVGAGSLGVNNWRNYRYSVFEVTVPLRNMIWTRFW